MKRALNEIDSDEDESTTAKETFVGFMAKYEEQDLGKSYDNKKNILKTVDEYNGSGQNICILLEEDEDLNGNIAPNNHRLVGLHHLHCRDSDKVLVGFRGFDFNNPVEINTNNLLGPPTGISTVDGKQDILNSIPGHSGLISSGYLGCFLECNSAWHLKPAKLKKAHRQISKCLMIDPYLYGKLQAGCGPDPDNIDPKALLTHLIEEVPIDHRLDNLVGFLWATAHGYNDSPTILNECEPGDKIGDPARSFAAWSASWINPRTPPGSKPTKSQEKGRLKLPPMSRVSVTPKDALPQ
jgi:hypothetical protein